MIVNYLLTLLFTALLSWHFISYVFLFRQLRHYKGNRVKRWAINIMSSIVALAILNDFTFIPLVFTGEVLNVSNNMKSYLINNFIFPAILANFVCITHKFVTK